MSRFQNLLCLTILLATVTFFNGATAEVKTKPALPKTGDPIIVGDVEPYTVKVVSALVADLEKECAKTETFKNFFDKVNDFSKYACSVSKAKDRESQMKAKAGSLFQAISALGSDEKGSKGGKGNKLQKEKTEAMETVKMLQSIGEKITGGQNNKTEINEKLQLTTTQQKEVKDGILKWLNVITNIAKKADESSTKPSSKSEKNKESKDEKSSTKSDKKSDKKSKDDKKSDKKPDKASKNEKSTTKSDKKSDKESKDEKSSSKSDKKSDKEGKDEKSSTKLDKKSDKKSKDEKSSTKDDKKSDKKSKDEKTSTKGDKKSDKESDKKKDKKGDSKKKGNGENADKKNEDLGPFRTKEERLKAEEADEYD